MSGVMRLPAQQESAVYVLAERMDQNDKRYEERFTTVNSSVEEVKGEVRKLGDKLDGVDTKVSRIEGLIVPPPPPPPPSGWHVGASAWAVIAVLVTAIGSVIGWMGITIYDLQPARIEAAAHYAAPAVPR